MLRKYFQTDNFNYFIKKIKSLGFKIISSTKNEIIIQKINESRIRTISENNTKNEKKVKSNTKNCVSELANDIAKFESDLTTTISNNNKLISDFSYFSYEFKKTKSDFEASMNKLIEFFFISINNFKKEQPEDYNYYYNNDASNNQEANDYNSLSQLDNLSSKQVANFNLSKNFQFKDLVTYIHKSEIETQKNNNFEEQLKLKDYYLTIDNYYNNVTNECCNGDNNLQLGNESKYSSKNNFLEVEKNNSDSKFIELTDIISNSSI